MSYRKIWIVMAVVILGIIMFVPVAQAEREPFEGISCGVNTNTMVRAPQGKYILGAPKGREYLRSTSKPYFQEYLLRQVDVLKAQGGVWSWNGYNKSMRSDGDFNHLGVFWRPQNWVKQL